MLRYHAEFSHHDWRITSELFEGTGARVCVCVCVYSLCVSACVEECVNAFDSKDYITEMAAAAGHRERH